MDLLWVVDSRDTVIGMAKSVRIAILAIQLGEISLFLWSSMMAYPTEDTEIISSPVTFRKSELPVQLIKSTKLALSSIMLRNTPWKDLIIPNHHTLRHPTNLRTLNLQATSLHTLNPLTNISQHRIRLLLTQPTTTTLQETTQRIRMWLRIPMTTHKSQPPARHTIPATSTILTSKNNSRNSMFKGWIITIHLLTLINHLTQSRHWSLRTSVLWMVKRPSQKLERINLLMDLNESLKEPIMNEDWSKKNKKKLFFLPFFCLFICLYAHQ